TLDLNKAGMKTVTPFKNFCQKHTKQMSFVKRLIRTSFGDFAELHEILGYSQTFTSLTQLNWNFWRLSNVDIIEKLTNLKELCFWNCSNLQNVDGFSKLINCSTLKLQFCHLLLDFNVLSKLTNLKKLHLTCNSRLRVMRLSELTNLTKL